MPDFFTMNTMSQSLALMLIYNLPAWGFLAWLIWRKRAYLASAREPFTNLPLRLAGESARKKADDLWEAASDDMLLVMAGSLLCGFVADFLNHWYRRPVTVESFVMTFIAMSIFVFIFGRRSFQNMKLSWQYRLGAKGEQVVGRELDRLLAQGYEVFHDVPFDGWNIDHVAVGPHGVFAIETKAWRKPRKSKNQKAELLFDRDELFKNGVKTDNLPVEQATRNASSLSAWITDSAAETVSVIPVLAFPGWQVTIKRSGTVAVFSGANMSQYLPRWGHATLKPAQIQRIAFVLTKQCRHVVKDESTESEQLATVG